MAKNPRIQVVLTRETYDALKEAAEVTDQSMSKMVGELVELMRGTYLGIVYFNREAEELLKQSVNGLKFGADMAKIAVADMLDHFKQAAARDGSPDAGGSAGSSQPPPCNTGAKNER